MALLAPDADLRCRLPRIAPERAASQTALIGLFNDRCWHGHHMLARLARPIDLAAASAWLHGKAGSAAMVIAPVLAGGRTPGLRTVSGAIDAVGLAATLDPLSDLLDLVERQVGAMFQPLTIGQRAPPSSIIVRLELVSGQQTARDVVLVALSDCTPAAAPLPCARSDRARWSALLKAPASILLNVGPLSAADVQVLATGDLLLLGKEPVHAKLCSGGLLFDALLQANGHQVRIIGPADGPINLAAKETDEMTTNLDDIPVPMVAEIRLGSMTIDALSALAPGMVVPLAENGPSISVGLRSGQTLVATGELIAVGDGYGIVIDRVGRSADRVDSAKAGSAPVDAG